MNILKYDHIIWDWNGTLFNDADLCFEIINDLLRDEQLPQITIEDYRQQFTFPVINYYQSLGFNIQPESFTFLSKRFISMYESRKLERIPFPGVENLLYKINSCGISQSILSAYHQKTLEHIVSHFKLDKYFIRLIGLNNIYAESKIENGKSWINELKESNRNILLIGDTLHDFEVASEIDADCILIAGGHQSVNRLKSCGVPVLNSLKDLL